MEQLNLLDVTQKKEAEFGLYAVSFTHPNMQPKRYGLLNTGKIEFFVHGFEAAKEKTKEVFKKFNVDDFTILNIERHEVKF
jgi:hypothetical protein